MHKLIRVFLGLFLLTPFLLTSQELQPEIVDQEDLQALREWIATKRQVTIKQLGGDLSISGEVRTEMQTTHETKDGVKQRGPSSVNPNKPVTAFDVEVNLMLDYRTTRSWGSVKLEFDNDAGNVLGVFDSIAVERAFFGGRIYDGDIFTAIAEVGRRRFAEIFASRIQFASFMDGIVLKFDWASDVVGDMYIHGGPFLINERQAQYGYVMELGILNIGNTGFYSKYSVIDWDTKSFSDPTLANKFRFINSQLLLGYKFVPGWLQKMVTFYAAGLFNHAAKSTPLTNNSRANYAGYVGFSIGTVRAKGDWAFDANFQFAAQQAIPDFDASGLGRGNASAVGFYTTSVTGAGAPQTSSENVVGRGNYKGFSIDLLYLLTNNLTISQTFQWSTNLNKNIGPDIHYNQYEVEFIYAF